jgi:histidinol-phosphatase (PHP family)
MLASYHNHTIWSDGQSTIAELVEGARGLGLDELGISDHFVLPPEGDPPEWSMPPSGLDAYVAEIRAAQGQTLTGATPVVRLGLEVDWFPGLGDPLRNALAGHDFDYLIGSVHTVGRFTVDGSPAGWERRSDDERNAVHHAYWLNMRSLAESGLFDIAAHLDLTKKFGFLPTVDLTDVIVPALDAIAAANVVVEVNTAGWHKPCADAYPSLAILRECRERDIPVTINADAHRPEHLVRDFDRAAARLREAGYDEIARFAKRQRTFDPLP